MKIDEPNARRHFIREGGSLLLATAGLLAVSRETVKADTEEDPCECLQGVVLLRHHTTDGSAVDAVLYKADPMDGSSARLVCLKAALGDAAASTGHITIELLQGDFHIPEGYPLMRSVQYPYSPDFVGATYSHDISIIFGEGTAVVYESELDAQKDWRLYPGGERHAKNFGARPNMTGECQKQLQAALFSMPPNPAPCEPTDDYPDIQTRCGRLILETGGYLIGNTIWITGYQELIGNAGQPSVIFATDDFAPDAGSEKFMIRTANYWISGSPSYAGPNFSFNIRVLEIQLANDHAENTKISGIEYGCGQGGELRMIIGGMGCRSVVLRPTTSHVSVSLWCVNGSGIDQTGPHLHMVSVFSIHFPILSLEHINNHSEASTNRKNYTIGSYTDRLAALMAWNCNSLSFGSMAGESNGFYAFLAECRGINIAAINHTGAGISGNGGTVLRMIYCYNCYVGSISGRYFEKLFHITGSDHIHSYPSSNAAYAMTGAITLDERMISPVAGSLTFVRNDNEAAPTEGARYAFAMAGTPAYSGLFLFGGTGYQHMQIKHGTISNSESGVQVSTGYNIVLDDGPGGGADPLYGVFVRSKLKVVRGYAVMSSTGDPTASDIADGFRQTWYNSTSGEIRDWVNAGGTMMKSAEYT